MGADLYIEDTPSNIEALAMSERPVIAFTNPTNRQLASDLRVDTWDEVEAIVREHVTRSGRNIEPAGRDAEDA